MITQGQSGGNVQTAKRDAALALVGGQEEASGRCGGQQNQHSLLYIKGVVCVSVKRREW